MWLVFMRSWWKEILVAILVAGAMGYVMYLNHEISSQREDIVKLETANGLLKDANTKLEASVSANNAAIEKIAAGAETTNKAFSQLNGNVKGQLAGLDSRLKSIVTDKKPVTCAETIQYLLDAAREYPK